MSTTRDMWSGRAGFILATVGSAVGIGSIWKFPYEVGANGGSAFVLFYFLGLALVVVPLMFAEFAIDVGPSPALTFRIRVEAICPDQDNGPPSTRTSPRRCDAGSPSAPRSANSRRRSSTDIRRVLSTMKAMITKKIPLNR
jgi:sodium:neurotransmitter symporter family protein